MNRDKIIKDNKITQEENNFQLAIETILKLQQGKYFFKYLLNMLQLYDYNFSADPIRDAYSNGRRSVALDLISLIDDDLYQEILKEKL